MEINLIIGIIPFLLSFAVCIVLNVLKFNTDIIKAQKHELLKSFILLALFIVATILDNSGFLNNESSLAFNHFLVIISGIFLYWIFALQAATFIVLLIKCGKNRNYSDITLSELPELLLNEYKTPDSVLKENNKDNRTYAQRIKTIIFPAVTLVFMYFIFGVCETYFVNIGEWYFDFWDIFPVSLAFSAVLMLPVCAAAYFIKGANLDMITMILTSLCIVSYIQNAFLNVNTFINGSLIDISDEAKIINLLVWLLVVFLIPYVIYSCFYKKNRKNLMNVCSAIAVILLIMQGAGFSDVLINGLPKIEQREKIGYGLNGYEQYEVSSEENVIVFIMDSYYSGFFDEWLEIHPEYYETLSDFVYFNNVGSECTHTAFSMPALLTAHPNDYTISIAESNKESWNSEEAEFFYNSMHNDGFTVRLYNNIPKCAGGAENMLNKIDNVYEYSTKYTTQKLPTYFSMTKLSAYKYLPLSLKDAFYISDSYQINRYSTYDVAEENLDMGNWKQCADSSKSRGIDAYNFDYYSSLKEGLTTTDKKLCIFQYLFGMHDPFISAYSNTFESNVMVEQNEAQKGCIDIFVNYITQLKDIGVYDNSTIILTADHGKGYIDMTSPIMLVKPKGRKNDRLVINSAPGNLQTDLLPTILDCTGLEYGPLDYSLFSIDEDMQRERTLRMFYYSPDFPDVPKCGSVGYSTYNYYEEYKYTGRVDETDFESMPHNDYPITDHWW